MLAQSASTRSRGSAGPSIPGMPSGRIDGTVGTQLATPRPASRSSSTFAASSSGSFISQIPIPSNPAAAYAATSSAKEAFTVEISDSDEPHRLSTGTRESSRRGRGAFVSSL